MEHREQPHPGIEHYAEGTFPTFQLLIDIFLLEAPCALTADVQKPFTVEELWRASGAWTLALINEHVRPSQLLAPSTAEEVSDALRVIYSSCLLHDEGLREALAHERRREAPY